MRVWHQAVCSKTVESATPPRMAEVRTTHEQLPLTRQSYKDVLMRLWNKQLDDKRTEWH